MHIQQLSTILDLCVYVVYAYFECMHVCIWCTCPHPGIGEDQSEFRFQSIRNRFGKMKIWFRLIRTEILFRKSGSGFLKPYFGRPLPQITWHPWGVCLQLCRCNRWKKLNHAKTDTQINLAACALCADAGVINNSIHICVCVVYLWFLLMHACFHLVSSRTKW